MTETLNWLAPTEPPTHGKRVLVNIGAPRGKARIQGGWDVSTSTWRDMDGGALPMSAVIEWSDWPRGSGA